MILTLVFGCKVLYSFVMNSKDFVTDIVEHLTGDKTVLDIIEDKHGAIMTIHPTGNVSSLIGKGGCTIDSIRVICKAIGYNGKHRIKIRIDENDRRTD